MKSSLIITLIFSLFVFNCTNDKASNPFLIAKQHVGLLTDSTQVKDLELVFPNDSIVKFSSNMSTIEIFEKGGKKLLDLSPKNVSDSTSVISSVHILDDRYKTEKSISTLSTFKDLKEAYQISKIDNLINVIMVSVNEINASFTIDKNELPASLRFDRSIKIEAIQIPEKAKIKHFLIHW